jgi:transcription initiation factor IIE alpha subunit
MIFLLLDERPQRILFICPCCQQHNQFPAQHELECLLCQGCGITLDGSQAELEVLTRGNIAVETERGFTFRIE